jgi:hypothetical protein
MQPDWGLQKHPNKEKELGSTKKILAKFQALFVLFFRVLE